ncbi:MAG: lysophospholipid acyltransferase family protein [Prolixibacteraceae bacterium]
MKLAVKHHFLLYPFFNCLMQYQVKRNFYKIELVGKVEDKQKAVLVIANHTSWWDGFWINHLNQQLFKRKFTFLMREDQLQKHWYFKYTGGIPINKGSRSVIESLQYCKQVLTQSKYLMLIFPQGKIHSMYHSTFTFEKGLEIILKQTNDDVQVIFTANLVDYFSQAKPSVYIYFEEYSYVNQTISEIEAAYQQFYLRASHQQQKLPK